MKTISLASQNPVKAQATLDGFERMFPGEVFKLRTFTVESGVGDQPRFDEETLQGALSRAQGVRERTPEADYWVGIEGGVEDGDRGMVAFAWVVVLSGGTLGKGRTGAFFLPDEVADLVREGKELGMADDIVFERQNSKQEEGAVGILTKGVLNRAGLYEQAVILALIPFKNPGLYRDPGS